MVQLCGKHYTLSMTSMQPNHKPTREGYTRMRMTVTVCDVCASTGVPTKHYEIRSNEEKVKVDLCEPHAEPLRLLMTAGNPGPATATRAPSTRRRTTLEEIERQKQQQKD